MYSEGYYIRVFMLRYVEICVLFSAVSTVIGIRVIVYMCMFRLECNLTKRVIYICRSAE